MSYVKTCQCDFCKRIARDEDDRTNFSRFDVFEVSHNWFFKFATNGYEMDIMHVCPECMNKVNAKIQKAFNEVAGKSVEDVS